MTRTDDMDFRYAYTLSKKKVKEILGKEIPLSSGLLSVLLSGCAGIILLEISAGVMVAIGAGLLALSVILHTTVMAEEIRKGKEKVMKREPKKKTEMKSITDYTDEGEGKP